MIELITAIRRALDLEAPEDGLCTWKHEGIERFETNGAIWESRKVYRCREPWHHNGGHYAPTSEEHRS